MKVLHLVGQEEDDGGILSVIRALQAATASRGISHQVWVNRRYEERRRPALDYRYSRFVRADGANHLRLLAAALWSCPECLRLLRAEAFDLIHSHSRGTLLVSVVVARWLRRPVVVTHHTYARRIGLYRWVARQPRVYTVVLTPNMARHFGWSGAEPRLAVISACCADHWFSGPVVERRREAGRRVVLAGVGNVVRWKNWHLLVQSLATLSDEDRSRIEFRQWGPVPNDSDSPGYARELNARVHELGLEQIIRWLGPAADVKACVGGADWFVLPSTNEPCSVALIEALALGLPSLATAGGGNVDIVQAGKTGWLFPPEDSAALAEALRSILRGDSPSFSPEQIRDSVRLRSGGAVGEEYARLYGALVP